MRQIEHEHQKALMQWARLNQGRYPLLRLLFAIPNGGQRHKAVAAKLKAEGVKSGVPDLCLPVTQPDGFCGLFIELKSPKGRATAEQQQWMLDLFEQGYRAVVCHGWEAARDELVDYLQGAE